MTVLQFLCWGRGLLLERTVPLGHPAFPCCFSCKILPSFYYLTLHAFVPGAYIYTQ